MALSWTYTSTVTVTGWQYRRESALGDFSGGQKTTTRIWGPWTPISGAATRSHTVTGLTNGSEYGFEVRAVNGVGAGTAASTTAVPIDDFALGANQPNPFNPETTLRYALPRAQPVRLTVYDMLGQQVRVLVDGEQPPGWHQVVWDGRDQVGRAVASGIYLYRLQTSQFSQTRKMILLR